MFRIPSHFESRFEPHFRGIGRDIRTNIRPLVRRLRKHRIAHKIALGYFMAIGLAVVGTSAGLIVGSVAERQALQQYETANDEAASIYALESQIFTLVLHPQKLLASVDDPLWWEYEVGLYRANAKKLRETLADLQQLDRDRAGGLREMRDRSDLAKSGILTVTPQFLADYTAWSQVLWSPAREGSDRTMQDFVRYISNDEWQALRVRFERLSEDLLRVRRLSERRSRDALARLEAARQLRFHTVLGSMTLATLLAIVLAIYTSRAIARPIRYLTDITQRITDSEDFGQRVRVETYDETARLAESVDRLVRWAGQYTHDLTEARETLEDRVEQRTEALKPAQAQVVQSEKMSSLGQMVAGLAHEINNPINFIHNNLTYANQYLVDLLELATLYRESFGEATRSEERRVGKECRSRWSPYH